MVRQIVQRSNGRKPHGSSRVGSLPRSPLASHGNIFAPRQMRYTPLAKVCQHDTIREQCPYTWSESVSRLGAGGGIATLRILAVIYLVQAGVGIATGVAYAVWLLYW